MPITNFLFHFLVVIDYQLFVFEQARKQTSKQRSNELNKKELSSNIKFRLGSGEE